MSDLTGHKNVVAGSAGGVSPNVCSVSDGDEHSAEGLLAKLAIDCDATPAQLRLVRSALGFFESHGVIADGQALPLYEACPCGPSCWKSFSASDYPPPSQAEAAVPWIGQHFAERRIVVVAINFNFYGGLGAQWWVRRGDIHERLGRGKRSLFPYRVGQYLAALLASQRGEAVTVDEDPAAGAEGFESCAFIQAVQCSPRPEVGRPSDSMWNNCPPRYLLGQLELLEPRLVMAVGRRTWPWVRDLCGVQVREYRPSFWRGSSNAVEVVFVNHPSHGGWRYSLPSLVESLGQQPLRAI